jgi:hypothetical protein
MAAGFPSRRIIPAQCQICGTIFVSRWGRSIGVFGEGSVPLEFVGNTEPCVVPGCGGKAVVAGAVYNFSEHGAEVLSGPATTREMLLALRAVLEQARSTGAGIEKLRSDVEDISPHFAPLFDFFKSYPEVSNVLINSFVMIMLFILTMLLDDDEESISIQQNFYTPPVATQQEGTKPSHPATADQPLSRTEVERLIGQAVRRTMAETARGARGGPPIPKSKPRAK